MHEENVLVYHIASAIASPSDSKFEADFEINNPLISDSDFNEETQLEYVVASASNADYETAIVNRLDVIAVSVIFSACFLFLLLLRHRS